MQCDICGKETELIRVKIEGTIMNVCRDCGAFGTELKELPKLHHTKLKAFSKPTETIKSDFASQIRTKRERMGLKQEEFAKHINEKLSLVHKIETGSFTPSIKLAKKIEKYLGIRLIEEDSKQEYKPAEHSDSEEITLGDLLKLKK